MRIGIALAAYDPNHEHFSEQLSSIQSQTYQDWICVITLDSPLAPLVSNSLFKPFFEDPRFQWHQNEKRLGHKKNFEKAIQLALAQGVNAIGCSDQDDVWYLEKLAISAKALGNAGPLSLVHCDMHELMHGQAPRSVWKIESRGVHNTLPRHLLVRNVVAGCAMLLDAELVRRFPTIPHEAEFHDHWYALVASAHGGIHPIHQPLFSYRQHGGNVVGVTPFFGIFHLSQKMNLNAILKKCIAGWEKSRNLANAAAHAKIPLSPSTRLIYFSRWDLGLGLLAIAISQFRSDGPLARAALARAIGKLLSSSARAFLPSEETTSRNSRPLP